MGEGALQAVARFNGRCWKIAVQQTDGTPAGWFQSPALDLVVGKARDLVEDNTAKVTVEVDLPAQIEQRLHLAEQLVEDATRELETAISDLRAAEVSVPDIGYIFMIRRHRPDPTAMTITTEEISLHGLPADVVGLIWSDRGHGVTKTCRACVEGPRQRLYTAWQTSMFNPDEAFSADEEHELVRKRRGFECDFVADHGSDGSWIG